jgi:hypothetical protein
MADAQLNIVLKLIDEASGKIKQAMNDATDSTKKLGDVSEKAGKKVGGFGNQLKESSRQLRDLRRTAFIAIAALAVMIKTVGDASKYNEEAAKTFSHFNTSMKTLSVTIGQTLRPALEGIAVVVDVLRNAFAAAVGGAIKMGSYITEFFSNIKSLGFVEAHRRAIDVANRATDDFLFKIEEARARVQADTTLDVIKQRSIDLGNITVIAAKKVQQSWNAVGSALGTLQSALEGASAMGKGWAKAAAAVALGMAIINTAQGITLAFATHAWPFSMVVASLIAAAGAIEIATIAATRFHKGGFIRAHNGLAVDEVPIIAQTGEGILSRRGMTALGGEGMLNRLNAGASSFGDIFVSIFYPQFKSREDIGVMAEMLGVEIQRQLRYARGV